MTTRYDGPPTEQRLVIRSPAAWHVRFICRLLGHEWQRPGVVGVVRCCARCLRTESVPPLDH